MTLRSLAVGIWLLTGLLVLASFFLTVVMLRRVRTFYPDVWEAMGQPTLLNSSIRNGFLVTKFVMTGKYRSLQDRRIKVLGDALFVGNVLIFTLTISFIFLIQGQDIKWSVTFRNPLH